MSEKVEIIRRLLGTLVVAIGCLGCTLQLYRFSRGKTRPVPVITLVIIGSTALVTGLQFVFPEVLTALRRNREALLAGEWWRMVTPLFVHAYGWWHACVNGFAAIIFCPLAERLYGKKLWALYFIPGVVGQIFGYLWSPNTAGSSLGIAGVMGGLFAFVVCIVGSFQGRRSYLPCVVLQVRSLCVSGAIFMVRQPFSEFC